MATKEELHEKMKNGVVEFEEEPVIEACQQVLDEGYDPGSHHGRSRRGDAGGRRPL